MPEKPAPPELVLCQKCGRQVPALRWACPYCGSPLHNAGVSYAEPASQTGPFRFSISVHRPDAEEGIRPLSKGSISGVYLILEIVAFIAVLGVVGVLIWRWLNPPAQKSTLPDRSPSGLLQSTDEPGSSSFTPLSVTVAPLVFPTAKGAEKLPPVNVLPLQGQSSLQVIKDKQDDYSPALSRDQRHLIYTTQVDGHWQVMDADPNSGKLIRQITSGEIDYFTPSFNADGTQLLVVADWSVNLDIFLLDYKNGRVLRQLTFDKAADYAPNWLPDYSGIVFTSERDGNAEIYLMKIPAVQVSEPPVTRLTNDTAFDGYPSVSHDGTLVTFYSDRAQEYNYDIYVMPLSNPIPRRLTKDKGRDASPVFSAGDAWIVFESNRSGNYELYSIRTTAEEDISVRNLTYSEASEYMPVFSPDGLWLFYLSDYSGKKNIYRQPWP